MNDTASILNTKPVMTKKAIKKAERDEAALKAMKKMPKAELDALFDRVFARCAKKYGWND